MTARPGDAARAAEIQLETKGGLVRGLNAALTERKILETVASHLDPLARRTLLDPPLASSWHDGRSLCELQTVIFDLYGAAELRAISRRGILLSTARLTQAFTSGLMRLFGATPATLFARLNTFTEATTRGLRWAYTATGPSSCLLEMTLANSRNVPLAVFEGSAGNIESVFDVCGARNGDIAPSVLSADAARNRGTFVARW